jgi:hypothetical protein
VQPCFLSRVLAIFEQRQDVGLVQLRAVFDPNQNWGKGKPEYSPWSCSAAQLQEAGINIWCDQLDCGHTFYIADHPNGFNNNPICIRKQLYKELGPYPECVVGSDPRHGETLYQDLVAKSHWLTAHVSIELFYHRGLTSTVPS